MLVGHTEGLPEDLTRLSTTGLLCDREPRLIERWIESACAAGLIAVSEDQYRTLALTAAGRAVMAGRIEEVQMLVPTAARTRSPGAQSATIIPFETDRLALATRPSHAQTRGEFCEDRPDRGTQRPRT
jgi:hypothetical protein